MQDNAVQIIDHTKPVKIAPTDQETEESRKANEVLEAAKAFEVITADDAGKCADLIKGARSRFNMIEDMRKGIVKPFNDAVTETNARFKKLSQPLEEAQTVLNKKLNDWNCAEQERIRKEEAEERARIEEERKAQEEAAAQAQLDPEYSEIEPPAPPPAEELPRPVRMVPRAVGKYGAKSHTKTVWNWTLLDIAELLKHRPELVTVDEKAINAAVKSGEREIPGLRIYSEEKVVVR